jgi:tetratricopeptide (TPR) repeat protein
MVEMPKWKVKENPGWLRRAERCAVAVFAGPATLGKLFSGYHLHTYNGLRYATPMNQTPSRKLKAKWLILGGLALAVLLAGVIGTKISQNQAFETALERAEQALRAEYYDDATISLRRAIEIRPDSTAARFNMAFARAEQALQAKNYALADEHFKRALEIRPQSTWAQLDAGLSLESEYIPGADSPENSELTAKATRHYQAVLALPDETIRLKRRTVRTHRDALYGLGQVAHKRKEYAQAMSFFGKAIDADPKYQWAWCYRCFAAVHLAEDMVYKAVQESEVGRNSILLLADKRLPRERLSAGALRTLRAKVEPTLNSAVTDCQRALDIGGTTFSAGMVGLQGVYGLRAGLQEQQGGFTEDRALWAEWNKKWIQAGGPTETRENR